MIRRHMCKARSFLNCVTSIAKLWIKLDYFSAFDVDNEPVTRQIAFQLRKLGTRIGTITRHVNRL